MSRLRAYLRGPQIWPAIVAIVLLTVCYVVCFLNSGMLYLTNDDMSIQETLAGTRLGSPYPLVWFSNFIITTPISMLYGQFPGVQWWFIYSHLLMGTGLFLVNYGIARACSDSTVPIRIISAVVALAFDFAFLIYPMTKVAFTIVPGVLGAGVVCWIVSKRETLSGGQFAACLVLSMLALCHREESGLIVLCFVSLALLTRSLLSHEGSSALEVIKGCVLPIVVVLFVAGIVITGNRSVQNEANGPEYGPYSDARSSFVDYEHDSYSENKETYNEVGWNGDLYALVSNWCFMDESVNTESLNYVKTHQHPTDYAQSMSHEWGQLMSHPLAGYCLMSWIVIAGAAFIVLMVGMKWPYLCMQMLNVLGTVGLLVLQLLLGRILYRTVLVTVVSSSAFSLALTYRALGADRRSVLLALFGVATIAGMWMGAWESTRVAFDQTRIAPLVAGSQKAEALMEYAMLHPSLVYVKGPRAPSSTNPHKVYPGDKPTNVLAWGGSEYNSRLSKLRMEKNGLDSFTGEVFSHDNVRLVSGISLADIDYSLGGTDTLSSFLRWQRDKYGAKGVIQVDTPYPGVYVLRMIYGDENQDFYDQYEKGFILPVRYDSDSLEEDSDDLQDSEDEELEEEAPYEESDKDEPDLMYGNLA